MTLAEARRGSKGRNGPGRWESPGLQRGRGCSAEGRGAGREGRREAAASPHMGLWEVGISG